MTTPPGGSGSTPPDPFANRTPPPPVPPPPPHSPFSTPEPPPPGFSAPQPPYAQPPYAQVPYAQPPYGPQGYGYPAYPARDAKNWMNIVALITGLMSCFCLPAVLAIVFGHLGLSAAKRGEADNRGMGIAGLILGYLGLAAFIGLVAFGMWAEAECQADPNSAWCEEY